MRRTPGVASRGSRYVLEIRRDNAPPALFHADGEGTPSEVFRRMLETNGLSAESAVSFWREGRARRRSAEASPGVELIGAVRDMPKISDGAMVMLQVIFRDGPFVIRPGRSLSPEADGYARELVRAGLVRREGDVWTTTALGAVYPLDPGVSLVRDHGRFPLFGDAGPASEE